MRNPYLTSVPQLLINYSEIEILVYTFLLIVIVMLLLIWKFYSNKGKKAGYHNIFYYIQARRAGFSSILQEKQSKELGFFNLHLQEELNNLGYEDLDSLKRNWFETIEIMEDRYSSSLEEFIRDKIKSTSNPDMIVETIEFANRTIRELDLDLNKLIMINSHQKTILDYTNGKIDKYMKMTPTNFSQFQIRVEYLLKRMDGLKEVIQNETKLVEELFQPWDRLIELINLLPDRETVELKKIEFIIGLSEKHTLRLINLLIQENPLLGIYDQDNNTYTKGSNVDRYIQYLRDRFPETMKSPEIKI